jgi:hypothetical protein
MSGQAYPAWLIAFCSAWPWGVSHSPQKEMCAGPYSLILPSERPGLGERRIVQSNFGRLAPALAGDLLSWQSDNAVKAAQLLLKCMAYLEDCAGHHIHDLIPALCQVWSAITHLMMGETQCSRFVAL